MVKLKKEVIIVGALGVVLLGVGAFMMVPQGTPAAPVTSTKDGAKAKGTGASAAGTTGGVAGVKILGPNGKPLSEKDQAAADLKAAEDLKLKALVVGGDFQARDPFATDGAGLKTASSSTSTQPPATDTHSTGSSSVGSDQGGSGTRGMKSPMPVSSMSGGLPPAGGTVSASMPAPMSGKVASLPSEPGFKVRGIMVGPNPVAIFEDSNGSQKMVPTGGFVDGDTMVVAISRGRVVVKYRGKKKTLVIEEEAH